MTARTVIDIDNRIGGDSVHAGWQKGQLWAAPNTRYVLPYQLVGGDAANCAAAIPVLKAAVVAKLANGPVDVYGHSYAAEVIDAALRDATFVAGLPTDPAQLRFLKAGNPEHRFTGHDNTATGYALYGGNGCPLTTPFAVWEMTRQYDFYGDYPTTPSNLAAWQNVNGLQTPGLYTPALVPRGLPIGPGFFDVHIDYTNTPYFDAGHITYIDPSHTNLQYIWAPTYPIAQLQSIAKLRWLARSKDKSMRSPVETGYGRPMPMPAPNYAAL